MVTEVLVKDALSNEMISAGAELVSKLDEADFIVNAAFWFYLSEVNAWRLIIGSPEVRTHGPKKAYKSVQAVLSKMSDPIYKIALKDIGLLDSKDPLVRLLKSAIGTSATGISGIRFTHNVIDGVLIEDAHIYRNA